MRGKASYVGLTAVICTGMLAVLSAFMPSVASAGVSSRAMSHAMKPAAAAAAAVASPSFDTQLLALVNRYRIAHGRQPLTLLADLSDRAAEWSAHLRAVGALSHDRNLSAQAAAVCAVQAVRENVAYADATTPSKLLTNYLNSPPHRANILATDVRFMGLATVTSTAPGDPSAKRFWNTMKFVGGRCPSSVATQTAYHSSTTSIATPTSARRTNLITVTVNVRTRSSHGLWVAVYFTSSKTRVTTLITIARVSATSASGLGVAHVTTHATSSGSYLAVYGGGRVTAATGDIGSTGRHSITVTG